MAQKINEPNFEKSGEESEDLRVRRTRKLIQQAFVELVVEKGFSTLTVQDIADRAMVNRSTFYRHYLDKYDLLDKYMDEVNARIEEEEIRARTRQNRVELPTGLLVLLKHIEKNADFYGVMFGPTGDTAFVQRHRKNTEKRFQTLLGTFPVESDPNVPPIDLRVSYISYAGVGAIKWWLENGRKCSPEQLAQWLTQMSSASSGLTLEEYLRRANSIGLGGKPI